jgi:hypothetical protein
LKIFKKNEKIHKKALTLPKIGDNIKADKEENKMKKLKSFIAKYKIIILFILATYALLFIDCLLHR